MNTNNIVTKIENKDGMLVVSSRVVAEQLGKEHSKVIRSLEQLLTEPNVASLIFPNEYKDKKGEKRREYLLTQDGFILYMFNIQGYNDYKMAYINEFNRMKNQLQELNVKDKLLLNIVKAETEMSRAVAVSEFNEKYVIPLERNLEKTTKTLEHKKEVINVLVDEVKLKTQRQFLIEIIQMKGVDLISQRWSMLYECFEQSKHLNLKARLEAYNLVNKPKIKNRLDFIDKVLNDIPHLYSLAVKLFESDFKDKLQKYMDVL